MSAVFRTITAQVADHLRTALQQGRWSGELPGRVRLAEELGVNVKTVEAALRQLQDEGVLLHSGKGRRRRIAIPARQPSSALRVAILLSEGTDRNGEYFVELRHQLGEAGHAAFHPEKSLVDLGMNPARIARLVAATPADAWVVTAGSRPALEWFARQPDPAFALFGPMRGLRLAGAAPDKVPACAAATRTLLGFGHRRICLLARPRRRLPVPAPPEQAFLDELTAHGIRPASFNLPGWEENPDSLHRTLESLFRVTPPTAFIVDEAELFVAVMQFCGAHRLRVPEDVSLICTDHDRVFNWCHRPVAHIAWDRRAVIRRVVNWAGRVSRRQPDVQQHFTAAKFVPGATIGPAPRRAGRLA